VLFSGLFGLVLSFFRASK